MYVSRMALRRINVDTTRGIGFYICGRSAYVIKFIHRRCGR